MTTHNVKYDPQQDVESQVHAAGEFPAEELTPNDIDDIEAYTETDEFFLAANGCNTPWRTAKSLLTLRGEVNQAAPGRSKVSDGTIGDAAHCQRTSDHNPWVRDGNIGVVTAMDITDDPSHGCSANNIAESIRTNRDSRVKYIIWNRRIANSSPIGGSPAWEWRLYNGSNPHTKHIHISVKSDKPNYDSTVAWQIVLSESST
jgi:hypothetical protein